MVDTLAFPIEKTTQSRLSQVDFTNLGFGKYYSDHMFIAEYAEGKWHSPRIIPYGDLSLSPATSALHYGQAVFEGLKAYKNAEGEVLIFRPEANAQRLNASAERLAMPALPEDIFINGLQQLLTLDKDWVPAAAGHSLYIRPFMFATDAYTGVRPSETYYFIIFTCPVGVYYNKPVRVKVETEFTRAAKGGTGAAKAAGNYAASLLPATLAQKAGYDQLLWTDAKTHEYFEESGTMNVMFVIDGKLITPATSDSILKGITRDSVLKVAQKLGIPTEERAVSVKEVIDAAKNGNLQEAFGVGTAATIAPIAVIGHEGTDYTLPAVENRTIAPRIQTALDDIKTGKAADPFGWILKV
ncbi:branched-chain amino acid aminotransferase [Cytophagaceae bacterium DM2B3-1]|uniref:branched-chain-amino-acid transaminase n=1 Tax=Xanthocytophaga flava TaxID=3048013 RepID=A0ABT7CRP5_9BACT|nr:branched-chain amino acid aminotransferase [Xanthocytophaga flavus]MDJ1468649.1 branched-chain amino acid aminotransferase [Xanthocytophaga flavus]MDJ1496429.1 branched-chain amino acid aminotransferase [Xanthocytophaga flavus]